MGTSKSRRRHCSIPDRTMPFLLCQPVSEKPRFTWLTLKMAGGASGSPGPPESRPGGGVFARPPADLSAVGPPPPVNPPPPPPRPPQKNKNRNPFYTAPFQFPPPG